MSKLLEGKLALVLGIANKWSLAYAIAQAFSKHGATLALTYLGERQREAIEELSRDLDTAAILPCDVTKDEDLAALTESLRALNQPFGLSPGPRRERLFAGCGGARHGAVDDRRRLAEHPDLPGIDARGPELQRDGRGQGRARIDHAIPGERDGPARNPRERDLGRTSQDRFGARHQ